jgi:ATP-dependent DNA helicase RecQ
MIQEARNILKSVFGYDRFISLQQDVIENVLRGKDTLAVMPTGGGKSVCYQVPALLFDGLTIVVSPLISLMKDQVEQLGELGIPAVRLNSSLSPGEHRANVERMRRGEARLIYMAPETLLKPGMLGLLESIPVACLAIDEAHCISEWGPDFRPEYRQLAEVRPRMTKAVCIALTATATPRVRADIKASLHFDDSSEYVAGFNRENLLLRVVPKVNPLRQAIAFIEKFPGESGIIYCLTRRQVDELCAALRSEGFSAGPYHAGLSELERSGNQERFVRDEVQIMVATVAFGMGINKSNVRFVLHHDLPKNIESYYQEIGRSGRDGLRAECLLLFSYGDLYKIKGLISKKEGLEKRAANLQLAAMVKLAESEVCRRIPLLSYFGEAFPHEHCAMCDNCLAGERELADITIPAQKFLSCVKRTGESFGVNHVIDVLRGSMAAKVLQHGHVHLSTYGIGKDYSKKQWQQLARQFLHKGLMVQDPEFGGLSLTAKAWDVFKGREPVFGTVDEPPEPAPPTGQTSEDGDLEYSKELFEILRAKRKELAHAAAVPPYVIFSDKTLAELARHYPRTAESMLQIHGIGRAKLDKYGAIFREIIEGYCRDHPAERRPAAGTEPNPERCGAARTMRQSLIGEAFNAGQTVEVLARELNFKPSKVLEYLYDYFRDGHPLRARGLLPLISVPEEQIEKAMDAFDLLGHQLLRPVFDALNGEIGYEELKVLRLHHLSLKPPTARTSDGVAREAVKDIRRIVCLANSRKYSGRCVAGKELLAGSIGGWIRPVGRAAATGELSLADITLQNGKQPKLLDVITLPLGRSCPHAYQSENFLMAEGGWVWSGTLSPTQAPRLCDDVDHLWINGHQGLYGVNDRIPEETARQNLSSSLLFIRADELCFAVGESSTGLKKIRAHFTHKGEEYLLPVTDPVIEAEYVLKDFGRHPVESPRPCLTVSISEPFEGFCYKLVAGVVLQ